MPLTALLLGWLVGDTSPSRLSFWSLSIPVAGNFSHSSLFPDLDVLGLFQPYQVIHAGVTHTGISLPVNVKQGCPRVVLGISSNEMSCLSSV